MIKVDLPRKKTAGNIIYLKELIYFLIIIEQLSFKY